MTVIEKRVDQHTVQTIGSQTIVAMNAFGLHIQIKKD